MDIDIDEYVDGFKPQMMDVVYAWCTGATFAEICKMTDIFEGKEMFEISVDRLYDIWSSLV